MEFDVSHVNEVYVTYNIILYVCIDHETLIHVHFAMYITYLRHLYVMIAYGAVWWTGNTGYHQVSTTLDWFYIPNSNITKRTVNIKI